MPITGFIANARPPYKAKRKPKPNKNHDPHDHVRHQTAAVWAIQSVDLLHFGYNIKEYGLYAGVAIALAVGLYFILGGKS